MNAILSAAIELDDAVAAGLMNSIPGVTISAHCGIALLTGGHPLAERVLGRALDDLDRAHCFQAILGDLARARAVVAYLAPYEHQAAAAAQPAAPAAAPKAEVGNRPEPCPRKDCWAHLGITCTEGHMQLSNCPYWSPK